MTGFKWLDIDFIYLNSVVKSLPHISENRGIKTNIYCYKKELAKLYQSCCVQRKSEIQRVLNSSDIIDLHDI